MPDEKQLQQDKKQKFIEFYRKVAVEGYYSASVSYGRDVVIIAGGALTFFVYKYGGSPSPKCDVLTTIAWSLLGISILLIQIRHYFEITSHKTFLMQVELLNADEQPSEDAVERVEKLKRWGDFCFVFSVVFLCLGVMLSIISIGSLCHPSASP